MSAATATVSNLNGSGSKYIKKNSQSLSQSSSTRNQQQQQSSMSSSSVYNASSKTKQQPCIDDLDDMNKLSLSSTPLNNMRPVSSASSMKNGYPTYQATVASMTSSSAANSTGAASAILSSLSNVNGYEYDYADSPSPSAGAAAVAATMRPLIDRPSSSSLKSSSSLMSSSSCSSTTPATTTTAFKLEHFDIMNTVGTGTFGRVLVVKHKQTRDYYALKVMSISEVLRLKQTDHVRNEKQILQQIRHPFIINLYWTFHNDKFLYMLLDYVCGGELFSYLRNAVKFSNETAVFYAAEIVSALEYLHSQSIIYRDLKPENLLLDREGHIRMCDFGFAKKVYDRTWTLCGTPEYLAPEIIVGKGHHKAVDWWALGILIYEMLVGYPPFYDENPFQIYQKILASKIDWPRHIDLVAKDLIRKLLANDRTKRLGTMKNGPEDVKRHKWFRSIVDWNAVAERKLQPPIVPKVAHDGDTKNFDKYDEDGWRDVPVVSDKNLEPFVDF